MSERELIGRLNVDLAWQSGWWDTACSPEESTVWGRQAQPSSLEMHLLGRRYSLVLEEELSAEDGDSGLLYVEDWDITEKDLHAINEGLERRADETDRELKASATGFAWRLGLLWIHGPTGVQEIQASTSVDYRTTFAKGVDPYEQISADVYNSVSAEDLERNGWMKPSMNDAKIQPHQGSIALEQGFDTVYDWLAGSEPLELVTEAGTSFTAKARVVAKGKHLGERVILFLRHGSESARCYACCWNHYYNCNRTRIGMYCKAVDEAVD